MRVQLLPAANTAVTGSVWPHAGRWREVLNTDADIYNGAGNRPTSGRWRPSTSRGHGRVLLPRRWWLPPALGRCGSRRNSHPFYRGSRSCARVGKAAQRSSRAWRFTGIDVTTRRLPSRVLDWAELGGTLRRLRLCRHTADPRGRRVRRPCHAVRRRTKPFRKVHRHAPVSVRLRHLQVFRLPSARPGNSSFVAHSTKPLASVANQWAARLGLRLHVSGKTLDGVRSIVCHRGGQNRPDSVDLSLPARRFQRPCIRMCTEAIGFPFQALNRPQPSGRRLHRWRVSC